MSGPNQGNVKAPLDSKGQGDPIRIGIIGMGKMGLLHMGLFNSIGPSKVVAISEKQDMILTSLKQFVKNVDFYKDYQEMTSRTDIDAVIITTPTFLHKEMIIDALSKNKAVFVEKPLAKTYGECREIMGHVGHRVTSVGYCRRFLATYRKIKETIDSGILGMPLAFEGSINVNMVRKQTKGWQYSLESGGGGVTIDLGCHLIDIIHYLLGDFKEVSAVKSNFFSRSVEDFLMGTARMKNNAIGSIHASWSYGGSRYPEMGIQIEFENGRIEATDRDLSITMADKGDSKGQHNYWTKQQLAYPVPINLAGPEYTLEDIHFIECIKGSKESMCSFHQSTKTNLVIDSLYRSAELDKPIVIASEAGE